jgi:isoleucyl-tRNA synthetase
VVREFKLPAGRTLEEVDAGGDGDVLVMLELEQDEALLEIGTAREVVNKFMKMRKAATLIPGQVSQPTPPPFF